MIQLIIGNHCFYRRWPNHVRELFGLCRQISQYMLRFMSRRFAGSAEEALELQGNLAQQAQHDFEVEYWYKYLKLLAIPAEEPEAKSINLLQ